MSADAKPISISATNPGTFARRGRSSGKGRSAARQPLKRKPDSMAPTAERLAKGDIAQGQTGGFRAVEAIETMRDRRELAPIDPGAHTDDSPLKRLYERGKLDHAAAANEAMFMAAEKLKALFIKGALVGIRAQDLNNAGGGGFGPADMPMADIVTDARTEFRIACKLMGWHDAFPHRGAGRLVVSVVCHDMAVVDAAKVHLAEGRKEVLLAAGMDRLREGLLTLALHWRLYRG